MKRAMKLSGYTTKRETVEAALRLIIRLKEQESVRDLRGIGWEGDLDAMRRDR
jgi:Arc/MetJ family transcription regulator